MQRSCLIAAVTLLLVSFAAGDDAAPEPVRIEGARELLKFHKDRVPALSLARPFIRFSPSGNRYIRIRVHVINEHKAKLHVGQPRPDKCDMPTVWDEAIPAFYCRLGFAGIAWRADSQRVLFLQEPSKDHPDWAPGVYGQRMRPWAMKWDVKMPQFGLCRHMRLRDKGETGCTALSYSPDGTILWTAFSDPKEFKSCGITENVRGRAKSRILYHRTGAAIYYLVPSPDGRFLAWLEVYPRKAPFRGPDVVVMNSRTRKTIHRIALSRHIPGWLDAQPPVWTVDSGAICYGDVVAVDKVFRREVRVRRLGQKAGMLIVRDALAVGAVAEGIIVNRGPSCVPMRQHISSRIPPAGGALLPTTNDVVLCDATGKAPPVILVRRAFAQQVRGRRIIYAQRNGDDLLVMRADLKRPAETTTKREAE